MDLTSKGTKSMSHIIKSRHRRVIDESGREVDDTQRFPRLHHVSELLTHHRDDDTQPILVSHLLHDGRSAATSVLPVHGARTIVMRRPAAPLPPAPPSLSERFPRSFFEIPEFVAQLNEMQSRVHAETHRMFDQFGAKMSALLRRARSSAAAWRSAAVTSDGYSIAAAYAAAGTSEMPDLVAEVQAEILRRAKAGAAV